MTMKLRAILPAIVAMLMAVTLGVRQAGAHPPTWMNFYEVPDLALHAPPGTLIRYERIKAPPFFRAKFWRMLYVTLDYANQPILSSGIVVLPDYAPQNPAQRQIVAWAHPTTGVNRKCAPSLLGDVSGSISGLNELVAGGFVVAATDYPGLGTYGPVGYLVGLGQAHAVIDSVRAARSIPEVGGGTRYALWGYSQGAHAALFAHNWAQRFAPDLKLVGTAVVAPPTDLMALLVADIASVPGRILAAMTIGSWSIKYQLSMTGLISAKSAAIVDSINQNCIFDLGGALDAVSAQKPLSADFLSFPALRGVPWQALVEGNSLSSLGSGAPVLIAQGDQDNIVRPLSTLTLARTACRAGVAMTYVTIKGANHSSSARRAAPDAVAWIAARFAGRPATGNCR